jgi:uncharacterized protein with ParB-like and HNH nuclease domain
MAENKIELKSISDLLRMNFFIPSYQRGYRWTEQQVKDLLEDIQEFINKEQGGFYCVQPLVVRKSLFKIDADNFKQGLDEIKTKVDLLIETEKLVSKYTKWEVIDGQQRLTTIYILLSYLNFGNKYSVEYETRTDSKDFLKNIDFEKKEDNIDYYYIVEAKKEIGTWFNGKDDHFKDEFLKNLLNNVQFIWYESVDEDPVKVFTRLNIGKISLTNAELIKALFLNKSNFPSDDYQKIRLQQQEIANEWDTIEYTLQNDEFWLFLNKPDYDKPTRIDFIFNLICEKNLLKLADDHKEKIGTDEYKTFRYFYEWFKPKNNNEITKCWKQVKNLFQTFQEWFNDLKLYHYIGFLIELGTDISDILDKWNDKKTKEIFKHDYITTEIKNKIANTTQNSLLNLTKGKDNKKIRSLLLLHNIQSIIKQNSTLEDNEKYKLPIFYKFPFHLFKKENWDVEHIDSDTENPLENEIVQKEWLKCSSIGITDSDLKTEITHFLNPEFNDKSNVNAQEANTSFEDLYYRIVPQIQTDENKLTQDEKQKIWNLTLLDLSTNRSYGNAIFPAKRRVIIGKDQGKKITVDDKLKVQEENGVIAFIPPCTMNVFVKYYNTAINNFREWDRQDAETYLENIKSVLKDFLK